MRIKNGPFIFAKSLWDTTSSATYQEDEHLHKCVKTLQKIDIQIKEREKQKVIVITGTELLGELSFTIDDE